MEAFLNHGESEQLHRMMRRIRLSGPIVGVVRGTSMDGLCQRSEILLQITDRLNRVYRGLPGKRLDTVSRRLLGPLVVGSGQLCTRIAAGLRLLGPLCGVGPDDLEGLLGKAWAAAALWQVAARLKNNALDARLLSGSFSWFLVDRVVREIETAFCGPLSQSDRGAILDAFAPGLLIYDKVLRRSFERRQELKARREKLGQEVREAREAADAEEVMLQLLHGETRPSRDAIIAAARHHMEKHGTQPSKILDRHRAALLATATPPAAPKARIIR